MHRTALRRRRSHGRRTGEGSNQPENESARSQNHLVHGGAIVALQGKLDSEEVRLARVANGSEEKHAGVRLSAPQDFRAKEF